MTIENKIIQTITAHGASNFDTIYSLVKKEVSTKRELSTILKQLEQQAKIAYFSSYYYHIENLPRHKGFVTPGVKGGVLFSPIAPLLDLGANYVADKAQTIIANKQNLLPGQEVEVVHLQSIDSAVKGEDITIDGTHSGPSQAKTIATFVVAKGRTHNFDFVGYLDNSGFCRAYIKSFDLEFSPEQIQRETSESALHSALETHAWYRFEYVAQAQKVRMVEKICSAYDAQAMSRVGLYMLRDSAVVDRLHSQGASIEPYSPDTQVALENSRLDYRQKNFFTIDAITTRDIDDAICYEKHKDGSSTLYVAIADASSKVPVNSSLDAQAYASTSTFYLPHLTHHMLPPQLSEDQLSLHPNRDRDVVVCQMSFNSEQELVDTQFAVATINSKARLTYRDVDSLLASTNAASLSNVGQEQSLTESKIVATNGELIDFCVLGELAQMMISGSPRWIDIRSSLSSILSLYFHLQKEQSETYRPARVEFELNAKGKIERFTLENRNSPAQKIVEFCMIQANVAAARFVFERYPKIALFRNQNITQPGEKTKAAFYDFNLSGHAGLEESFYTHFTSPIRRYCDLVVHRIIKDILTHNKSYDEQILANIAQRINYVSTKARAMEYRTNSLVINEYLADLVYNKQINGWECRIVDFSAAGAVLRSEEHIEFFVPTFKLGIELAQKIKEFLTLYPTKPIFSVEKFLKELNHDKYYMQLSDVDVIFDKNRTMLESRVREMSPSASRSSRSKNSI